MVKVGEIMQCHPVCVCVCNHLTITEDDRYDKYQTTHLELVRLNDLPAQQLAYSDMRS